MLLLLGPKEADFLIKIAVRCLLLLLPVQLTLEQQGRGGGADLPAVENLRQPFVPVLPHLQIQSTAHPVGFNYLCFESRNILFLGEIESVLHVFKIQLGFYSLKESGLRLMCSNFFTLTFKFLFLGKCLIGIFASKQKWRVGVGF